MLFNSYEFIFLFLPITLFVFYVLSRRSGVGMALYWLVLASLFFYGWWKPEYLVLILGSVIVNFLVGDGLVKMDKQNERRMRRLLFVTGILGNLAAIGYFKYANFFVDNVNVAFSTSFHLEAIILPLGISFFTFQQIAYLVDAYKGQAEEHSFRNYSLFVTFFPQLIAGPIVHHKEMMPQFFDLGLRNRWTENLVVGLAIFSLGLFKKVVIADGVAPYANSVFDLAESGQTIYMLEAWAGSLAYTMQMYFDFSGYSDMALGLARMFGIRLPLNFNSPYKATNIIDFWRRWHMTLTRFLTSYVYNPVSIPLTRHAMLSRMGTWQTFWITITLPVLVTFFLSGIWHGAGWTFIVWGLLHGFYIVVNHAWITLRKQVGWYSKKKTWYGQWAGRLLTFIAVVVSFAYFRAESLDGAHRVLAGMFGLNGIMLPKAWLYSHPGLAEQLAQFGVIFDYVPMLGQTFPPIRDLMLLAGVDMTIAWEAMVPAIPAIIMLLPVVAIAFFFPNTQQIMSRYDPALEHSGVKITPLTKLSGVRWFVHPVWALVMGCVAAYATFGGSGVTQFLYFNF